MNNNSSKNSWAYPDIKAFQETTSRTERSLTVFCAFSSLPHISYISTKAFPSSILLKQPLTRDFIATFYAYQPLLHYHMSLANLQRWCILRKTILHLLKNIQCCLPTLWWYYPELSAFEPEALWALFVFFLYMKSMFLNKLSICKGRWLYSARNDHKF